MESYNIEYKEDISNKPRKLKEEIVSFLNSNSGGKIFLGVYDNGEPVAFENENQRLEKYKYWEEIISNWISNAFSPDVTGLIFLEPNSIPFTISISAGINKPYYYK
ncbi:MAG: ATP-binding protein, partial [Streptococcaceae bacterium]|nr:ATP-binding protein [Streptococcaceae bacterium]